MDLALFFDGERLVGDLSMVAGRLATDDGLRTAVLISLFSDARATPDELDRADTWCRGWAGEREVGPAGDRLGSKFWLRQREKQTEATRRTIEDDAKAALAWMIEDKVARAVEVAAAWVASERLGLEVVVVKPDGSRIPFRFTLNWATEAER